MRACTRRGAASFLPCGRDDYTAFAGGTNDQGQAWLTPLIAAGAIIPTSAVTPASAARRHVGLRNAAVVAGLATAAAAASGAYYSGYGFGGYGYGGRRGRCGGGAYC
jgi:hypothetical protein